jgi:hypothetical protein
LLKPFCKAYFVDSIDSDAAIEETNEVEDTDTPDDFTTVDPKELLAEIQDFVKEGLPTHDNLVAVVKDLSEPLKDLKNTIVTDALIKKAAEGTKTIQENNSTGFLKDALAWMKEADTDFIGKEAALNSEFEKLKKLVENLNKIQPVLKEILEKGTKLKMVENPLESEFPPISDNPYENFAAILMKANKDAISIK